MAVETPSRTTRRGPSRVFYGWWIVGGAFALQLLGGLLYFNAYGAYFGRLQETFGWSRTQIALAYTMSRAEGGLLGPLQGWIVDKVGARAVMRVGLVLFGLGFIAFSQVQNLWQFYGAYLLMSLGSSVGGFITINAVLANWFDKRRSTAMGIASMGWGVGGLLVPIVAFALVAFGWRQTAFWSGILILVIGLPLSQLFRHAPEPYGYLPDGARADEGAHDTSGDGGAYSTRSGAPALAPSPRGFTARQALRQSSFWFIALGHASAMFSVSAINVLLIPHLEETAGMSVQAAAFVVLFLTAVSVVGQGVTGVIGDRFEKRKIITLCMVGHTIALLVLFFATSLTMVLLFAFIHGVSWGFRGPLMTAIRAEYFGRGAFATIMGYSSLIIQFGTMSGPLLGAAIADATGSYRIAFLIISAFTAAGGVAFFLAKRPQLPPAAAMGLSRSAPVPAH
jgi:MFS family permease